MAGMPETAISPRRSWTAAPTLSVLSVLSVLRRHVGPVDMDGSAWRAGVSSLPAEETPDRTRFSPDLRASGEPRQHEFPPDETPPPPSHYSSRCFGVLEAGEQRLPKWRRAPRRVMALRSHANVLWWSLGVLERILVPPLGLMPHFRLPAEPQHLGLCMRPTTVRHQHRLACWKRLLLTSAALSEIAVAMPGLCCLHTAHVLAGVASSGAPS